MSKRNEDAVPQQMQIAGAESPAVLVDGAGIMFRGNICRLVFMEAGQVRVVLAAQTVDAVSIAEQIIAGRNEMLKQMMDRSTEAPSSPIPARPQ